MASAFHRQRLITEFTHLPFWQMLTNQHVDTLPQQGRLASSDASKKSVILLLSQTCPACLDIIPDLRQWGCLLYRQQKTTVYIFFVDWAKEPVSNRVMPILQRFIPHLKYIPALLEFNEEGVFSRHIPIQEMKDMLQTEC